MKILTERQKSYRRFLSGPIWGKIRQIYHGQDKKSCFICGTQRNLQIHHLQYRADKIARTDRLTDPVNLVLICGFHHKVATFEPRKFERLFREKLYPKKKIPIPIIINCERCNFPHKHSPKWLKKCKEGRGCMPCGDVVARHNFLKMIGK